MSNKDNYTNQEHLESILNGDAKFVNDFYQKIFPLILKLVINSKGSEEDAKDLFQEGMLLILYKSQSSNFTLTSTFSAYFYGVCKNLWGNHIQKKTFRDVPFNPLDKYNSDIEIDSDDTMVESRLLFDRAFSKLNDSCKKLLNLFFDKIPMQLIAIKMGFISVGYTKRRKHQCKEKLIELVKQEPGYNELCEK